MRAPMTRPVALALALAGCGGLENLPLTRGVVRGTLERPDGLALVAVMGTPALATRPGPEGAFTLADVPQGEVDLLVVLDGRRAERRTVSLAGGAAVDLGLVVGRPAGVVQAHLRVPELLRTSGGEVAVVGTPLLVPVSSAGEARLVLGAGCYTVQGRHPGLAPIDARVCVDEGATEEVELELPEPDGAAGHEGCALTGCEDGAHCGSDGRCRAP